jgi:hypothetical protein
LPHSVEVNRPDQVQRKAGASFKDMGERTLNNVARAVKVYIGCLATPRGVSTIIKRSDPCGPCEDQKA